MTGSTTGLQREGRGSSIDKAGAAYGVNCKGREQDFKLTWRSPNGREQEISNFIYTAGRRCDVNRNGEGESD